MKIKETKSGSIKIKMTLEELTVINSILSYVLLGQGDNSDVVFDFIDQASNFASDDLDVELSNDDGSIGGGLAIRV
jgi:hypothetical protein